MGGGRLVKGKLSLRLRLSPVSAATLRRFWP
jgi:hypothetical protein